MGPVRYAILSVRWRMRERVLMSTVDSAATVAHTLKKFPSLEPFFCGKL
jgi:hypothetical protein